MRLPSTFLLPFRQSSRACAQAGRRQWLAYRTTCPRTATPTSLPVRFRVDIDPFNHARDGGGGNPPRSFFLRCEEPPKPLSARVTHLHWDKIVHYSSSIALLFSDDGPFAGLCRVLRTGMVCAWCDLVVCSSLDWGASPPWWNPQFVALEHDWQRTKVHLAIDFL